MTKEKRLEDFPDLQRAMEAWDGLGSPPEPNRRSRRRSPARHGRRCNVCRHPDRDAIEQAFLRWHSPEKIARDYGIAHHSSIYRHAQAAGLFSRRSGQLRFALENIIEQAGSVEVTANAVINAVRASACLTDDGHWVEPSRTYIVTRETATGPVSEPSVASAIASSIPSPPVDVVSLANLPPSLLTSLIANRAD